ncbi:nucleotide exchange factor GrpE [Ornithinibacillus halophilus]|uniref:Molecular chaperone GrpE (Heat shock protein) n=1 Tax=Ornithinibacillus halophilus TaxID=930117 RepID=A0A1M5HJQ9_9BACI|nr:nucleotide exchange factor GrpE [Ornithinibacillus halophilus]SHG16209.1 Molecular chaperone GrpE (heat shock protein) [Ornithinibacillus halophilus]
MNKDDQEQLKVIDLVKKKEDFEVEANQKQKDCSSEMEEVQQDLQSFYRLTLQYNTISIYLIFCDYFIEVRNVFQPSVEWVGAIKKSEMQLIDQYTSALKQLGREEVTLTIEGQTDIKEELMRLVKMPTPEIPEKGEEQAASTNLEEIIGAIKDDVKKGNRATFKMIQELQAQLDSLMDEDEKEEGNTLDDVYIQTLLNTFDQLDQILQSVEKVDIDETWKESVQIAVNNALRLLSEMGIEEVPALHHMFDGKVMESIGAVPADSETEIEQYHVHTVAQRGFRYVDNQELIRKARVITIS